MGTNTEAANDPNVIADISNEEGKKTLREWRVKRFRSKKDLAELLNVNPNTYAKMELKPEEMKLRQLVKVVEFLGCNLSDIVFFEDNSKNN